jgi:hypothetical protein
MNYFSQKFICGSVWLMTMEMSEKNYNSGGVPCHVRETNLRHRTVFSFGREADNEGAADVQIPSVTGT